LYASYLHAQGQPAPPWLTSEEMNQNAPS